jgi:hypothetical protein
MRRIAVIALALLVVAGFTAPAAASGRSRDVEGTLTGPGAFEVRGCGVITEIGSGTFEATVLGRGTYVFEVCIETTTSPLTFTGTASFTARNGARLDGVINATGTGPTFPVTITGGTQQFSRAAGSLVIGPLVQSNQTNCVPRVGICLNWTDNGPLTGTLENVPRHSGDCPHGCDRPRHRS